MAHPVIGIRPTIDGRRGPMKLRESLEDQTKSQQFVELQKKVTEYVFLTRKFRRHLESIASYEEEIDIVKNTTVGSATEVNAVLSPEEIL